MKKIICIIAVLSFLMIPLCILVGFAMTPVDTPPKTWEEFKEKYTSEHNEFPFANFDRLNEIGEIIQVYPLEREKIYHFEIALQNTETQKYTYSVDIYPLDEELMDKHPAWIYFYTNSLRHTYMDELDYTETSEPIPPRNEHYTPQFITYCAPEDFIVGHGAMYKYQKEGVDIYLDEYSNCYFKIENYFFRLMLCWNGISLRDKMLFKSEDGHRKFITEEEYIALQPNFEHNMAEYELGYIWNDKSELVSLLKEIVAGIPAEPEESSQPDESSDVPSNTVSSTVPNETTEPTVSDEPSESVSESSDISVAEPKGSKNTVWIIVIGAVTVALVIAAAIVIAKKKK